MRRAVLQIASLPSLALHNLHIARRRDSSTSEGKWDRQGYNQIIFRPFRFAHFSPLQWFFQCGPGNLLEMQSLALARTLWIRKSVGSGEGQWSHDLSFNRPSRMEDLGENHCDPGKGTIGEICPRGAKILITRIV